MNLIMAKKEVHPINNRGRYSEKEKKAAVKEAFTGKRGAITAVAKKLDVSTNTLHAWKTQLSA